MTRGHKPSTERDPSQRQLRVGEVAVAVLLMSTAPALAEVCDKAVGEDWRPDDGPVWLLNSPGWIVFWLAGLGLVYLLRSSLLGVMLAAWWVASAVAPLVIDVIPQHEIYSSLVQEGCRSIATDWLDAAVRIVLAATCIWTAHRASALSWRQKTG